MLLYKPITRWQKKNEIKRRYLKVFGVQPELGRPRTFNEKIQWLKLNYKDSRAEKGADKVTARELVAEEIGENYLIPALGIYDDVTEIDWQALPDKFVIKISDGYDQNIICTDKSTLDIPKAELKIREWLKPVNRHYWKNYEWNYKSAKTRILVEQFLGDENNQIHEYKFMYCGGKLAFIMVPTERSLEKSTDVRHTHFNEHWQRLELERVGRPPSATNVPKPKSLQRMLQLSSKLAVGFPVCRVDFYESSGEIKFGELTFTPGNGLSKYSPESWDGMLGDMIDLPHRNNFTLLEWRPIELRLIGALKERFFGKDEP